MLDALETLCEALVADVIAAWGVASADISLNAPDEANKTVPQAIISCESVAREFNGVRSVRETYDFEITGLFARVSGERLALSQGVQGAALGARLVATATYAGIGYAPQVTAVDLPAAAPEDSAYAVTVHFRVSTDVEQ